MPRTADHNVLGSNRADGGIYIPTDKRGYPSNIFLISLLSGSCKRSI